MLLGGRWGGVRGAMQLRMTLAEMGMVTIPSLLPMARVGEAFSDDGTPLDKNTISFSKQFFDAFLWYVEALCAERRKGVPYSANPYRTPQPSCEPSKRAMCWRIVRRSARAGDYQVAIFLVDGRVEAYETHARTRAARSARA